MSDLAVVHHVVQGHVVLRAPAWRARLHPARDRRARQRDEERGLGSKGTRELDDLPPGEVELEKR